MSYSLSRSDKTNGRWTKEQHESFLVGIQMYGKNWKKIEELIGTRNGSQIRSHAQKFFLKAKKNCSNDQNFDSIEQIQKENQTINSKNSPESETKHTNYSYFLGKIVQYSTSQRPFNFWHMFIDHQDNPNLQRKNQVGRKISFEQFEDQTKEDKAIPQTTIKTKQF